MPEGTGFPRPYAVAVGADPKVSVGILVQGVDEGASRLGRGLEAIRRPVVAVQAGRGSQVQVAGAGAHDRGGGQVGQILLLDLPGGEVHPVDAVAERGDPKVVSVQAQALDIDRFALRPREGQVFHGLVGQVQQREAAVFGAGEDVGVVHDDDRADHVAGQVAARAAAQVAVHHAPQVPVEGQAVVEHAHPDVPLPVAQHGPDVFARQGRRIGVVMGEDTGLAVLHQDDAVVGAQPAASVGFGDDAADLAGVRMVEGRGGVREDVGLEHQAAEGGGQDVSVVVRDDVLAGEPIGRAAAEDPVEVPGDVVETVHVPVGGQEPDAAVAVGLDGVAPEQGDGGVIHELLPLRVPAEDVLVRDPDHPVAVHGDVGRADEAAGSVAADRPVLSGLQVGEADSLRRDEPQPVLAVFRQAHRQGVQNVAVRVLQVLEMQAVVHADSFTRTQPDEAVAVLEDGPDGIVGEAVVGAEVPESRGVFLGGNGQEKRYEEG